MVGSTKAQVHEVKVIKRGYKPPASGIIMMRKFLVNTVEVCIHAKRKSAQHMGKSVNIVVKITILPRFASKAKDMCTK